MRNIKRISISEVSNPVFTSKGCHNVFASQIIVHGEKMNTGFFVTITPMDIDEIFGKDNSPKRSQIISLMNKFISGLKINFEAIFDNEKTKDESCS